MLANHHLQVNHDLIDTSVQRQLYAWVADEQLCEQRLQRQARLGVVWGLLGAAAIVMMLFLMAA